MQSLAFGEDPALRTEITPRCALSCTENFTHQLLKLQHRPKKEKKGIDSES